MVQSVALGLLMLCGSVFAAEPDQGVLTNHVGNVSAKNILASNGAATAAAAVAPRKTCRDIVLAMQRAEQAYATNPVAFFSGMNAAFHNLQFIAPSSSNDVTQSESLFWDIFRQTLQKPYPSDPVQALQCFEVKKWIAWNGFGRPATVLGKTNILVLAAFIGEIRSRKMTTEALNKIGPGTYSISGPSNWFDSVEGKAEIRQLEVQCEERQKIVPFQNALFIYDSFFTDKLLKICAAHLTAHPDDTSFWESMVTVAHLTTAEQKQAGIK